MKTCTTSIKQNKFKESSILNKAQFFDRDHGILSHLGEEILNIYLFEINIYKWMSLRFKTEND